MRITLLFFMCVEKMVQIIACLHCDLLDYSALSVWKKNLAVGLFELTHWLASTVKLAGLFVSKQFNCRRFLNSLLNSVANVVK